jgi:hypothetical protein
MGSFLHHRRVATSRRPSTSKMTENVKLQELINKDCSQTIQELADTVGISYGVCQVLIWTCATLFLHHDNWPTHMCLEITEFVIVFHPPYSLPLAPSDFALFPKLKMKLKGWRFETVSGIQRESQVVPDSINENDFHGAFDVKKKKKKDCCIHSQWDYFEGDSSQNCVS